MGSRHEFPLFIQPHTAKSIQLLQTHRLATPKPGRDNTPLIERALLAQLGQTSSGQQLYLSSIWDPELNQPKLQRWHCLVYKLRQPQIRLAFLEALFWQFTVEKQESQIINLIPLSLGFQKICRAPVWMQSPVVAPLAMHIKKTFKRCSFWQLLPRQNFLSTPTIPVRGRPCFFCTEVLALVSCTYIFEA